MTQERQQESGKVYRIACDQWYVVQPPIWEDNWRRARNWLAKVEATPDAPGGFTREWCERGRSQRSVWCGGAAPQGCVLPAEG